MVSPSPTAATFASPFGLAPSYSSPTPGLMPMGNAAWGTSYSPYDFGYSPTARALQSPAAYTATTYAPQPFLPQTMQGYGTLLLDSLSDALVPSPVVYAASAAPVAIANMRAVAGGVADGFQDQFGRVSSPVMSTISPYAAPVVAPVIAAASPVVSHTEDALRAYGSQVQPVARKAQHVATLALRGATRRGKEIWAGVRSPRSVHITQVPSRFNRNPAADNRDCGPASVAMAVRLVGKKIPGLSPGSSPQAQINRVRALAGKVDSRSTTTNWDLERALERTGAKVREVYDAAAIRQSVMAGKPVVLNGNPRNAGAYGPSFSDKQLSPYDGAHWIAVTGLDQATGKFIINDPLSKVGPLKVSRAQLEAYRGGSLGIEVSR